MLFVESLIQWKIIQKQIKGFLSTLFLSSFTRITICKHYLITDDPSNKIIFTLFRLGFDKRDSIILGFRCYFTLNQITRDHK